jgi:cytochrome c oxidase subunit 3
MSTQPFGLPADRRAHLGGLLFLGSLLIFFLASIVLFVLYAYTRRGQAELSNPLPLSFLVSTLCLVVVSGLLHVAISATRRERRRRMMAYLVTALVAAIGFTAMQLYSLHGIILDPDYTISPHRGVTGMVIVLAVLHALHVMGGIIGLALVTARAGLGRYDHERFWAIQFSAYYWHFLDLVWIVMLVAFWATSGGFVLT